jgi:pyruvate dehydrogenase E1 component
LAGEGLQHQDGSSHLVAATIPNCKAYDPAFASELAVIVDAGMRQMMIEQEDVFYYITLMNENYAQADLQDEAKQDIIRGCYLFQVFEPESNKSNQEVTLMGSGAILTEVIKAAKELASQGIKAYVYSVTSWSELARDGLAKFEASGIYNPESFIVQQLQQSKGPIIAASDYVRAIPESIRAYLPNGRQYITLGTDGFGRSDTRSVLRDYFGVGAQQIANLAKTL